MNRRAHRTAHPAVRFRNLAAASLVLSAALALSACSSSDGDSKPSAKTSAPASSPAPSTASADPDAAAKEAVLKTYDAFWTEQVKAYAQVNIQGTDLKKYASKDALGGAMGDVLVMKKAGTATTGAPKHRAQVTSLTLSGSIPKATVQDCLDISNWKTINKKSGQVEPFPSNQPLRYITTATAEKWGKQWLITKLTPEGDRTC
ncbi:hypothetical protein JK359_33060 [Streptomyces actinomycinicus]|uniref:Secreted protein/lipoprotein n=1 Tax=Streptomyces actinomycinicus TaxID=1695166 RepID=A0A937ENT5_9ACTN|nr:hypothetical protein [Streptomyces actinomycinicus]MBL1086737.1 hypothetical protein [Streptomyces actinomycinicus]